MKAGFCYCKAYGGFVNVFCASRARNSFPWPIVWSTGTPRSQRGHGSPWSGSYIGRSRSMKMEYGILRSITHSRIRFFCASSLRHHRTRTPTMVAPCRSASSMRVIVDLNVDVMSSTINTFFPAISFGYWKANAGESPDIFWVNAILMAKSSENGIRSLK